MANGFLASRTGRIVFYGLYAVGLTAFLVYWRFPSDLFKSWIENRLETMTKEPVSITQAKLTVPGFRIRGVRLGMAGRGPNSPALRLDEISADLPPGEWLSRERSLNLSGRLYGGTLRGDALLEGKDPERLHVKAALERIDAGRFPLQVPWGSVVLHGEARGTVDLWFSTDPHSRPSGEIDLESRNGTAREIRLGSLRLPELPYETLKARLALQAGTPAIERIEVAGEYGTIRVTPQPVPQSSARKARPGEAGLLLTIKESPRLKTRFPLLWALLQKLPGSGGSFRIPIPAPARTSAAPSFSEEPAPNVPLTGPRP